MEKSYEPPTLIEWGAVADLTQGTGNTNYTDGVPCTTPGPEGVTFYGSSDAEFCK